MMDINELRVPFHTNKMSLSTRMLINITKHQLHDSFKLHLYLHIREYLSDTIKLIIIFTQYQ